MQQLSAVPMPCWYTMAGFGAMTIHAYVARFALGLPHSSQQTSI
jgi:hypothetical protein